MKAFRFLSSLALLATVATAHDIITTNLTFARDISRIFAGHCLSCHGEKSSIPLVTYEQARPWAVSIKEQVLSRAMPPWGAVKGFGNLSPDHALSQEDILIIAAWVVGGAPQGSANLLPATQLPRPSAPLEHVQDAFIVETRTSLKTPLQIAGVKPLADKEVGSARLIARWPDGRIEPLLWLYHYDPKFAHVFTFQKPLALPAGAVVESSSPLRYALETVKAP